MAVKTREEILESFRTILGENPGDDSISFLEDVTDTLDDFEKERTVTVQTGKVSMKKMMQVGERNTQKDFSQVNQTQNQTQNQNQNQIIPRRHIQIYLRRFKRWLEELLTVR